MQYEFVLRDIDPDLGQHLIALADILSEASEVEAGFSRVAIGEDARLAALVKVLDGLGFRWSTSCWLPAEAERYERLAEAASDLREAVLEHRGEDNPSETSEAASPPNAVSKLIELARSSERDRYTLEEQFEALSWLLDQVNAKFVAILSAAGYPDLLKALTSLEQFQNDLRAVPVSGDLIADQVAADDDDWDWDTDDDDDRDQAV